MEVSFKNALADIKLKPGKEGAQFNLSVLPQVITQMGYTPGKLLITLTGELIEQGSRKAVKLAEGNDNAQHRSYILLENAALEQLLKEANLGSSLSLTGEVMSYKGKHYLWVTPEHGERRLKPATPPAKEQTISLMGQFVLDGEKLLFRARRTDSESQGRTYVVLENSQRQQVEANLDPQKEVKVTGVTTRYNGKDYLLMRKLQDNK